MREDHESMLVMLYNRMSLAEIARVIGVGATAIRHHVDILRRDGYVEHLGFTGKGCWGITSKGKEYILKGNNQIN